MNFQSPHPVLASALKTLADQWPLPGPLSDPEALRSLVFLYPRPSTITVPAPGDLLVSVEALTPEALGLAAFMASPRPQAEMVYSGVRANIGQRLSQALAPLGRAFSNLDITALVSLNLLSGPCLPPMRAAMGSAKSWIAATEAGEWLVLTPPATDVPPNVATALKALTDVVISSAQVVGEVRLTPPPPLNTAALLAAAERELRLTPVEVMPAVMNLYHSGLITFPITDRRLLTEPQWRDLAALAVHARHVVSPQMHNWDNYRTPVLGPGPIRPAGLDRPLGSLGETETRLFALIQKHAFCAVMPEAVGQVVRISAKAAAPALAAMGSFEGEVLFAPGSWREFMFPRTVRVAPHAKGTILKTEKRPRPADDPEGQAWSVADLIERLDSEQLGCSESYASVFQDLQAADLIVYRARQLRLSAKGQRAVEPLRGRLRLAMPPLAAVIENSLREVLVDTNPAEAARRLLSAVDRLLQSDMPLVVRTAKAESSDATPASAPTEPLPGTGDECPVCKAGNLVTRATRADPTKQFLSCNSPSCDFVRWPEKKKVAIDPLPGDSAECPKCTRGKMVTRAAGGDPNRRFLSCTRYPDCKHSEWPKAYVGAKSDNDLPGTGDNCSKCGQGTMTTATVSRGTNVGRRFLQCNRTDQCSHRDYPSAEWPDRKPGR